MKTRLLLLAFTLLATQIFAQKTETRSPGAFEKIAIAGGYDELVLQAGSEEKVMIEASGVELDKIVTEVEGKTLKIHMKKGSYNNTKIRLTVTYKSLNEISNSGSTDIRATSPIKGENFVLNSSGSGDFDASLDVRKFEVNISGSSDVKVKGQAEAQDYAISGSGDVEASELSGKTADVAISGSGDVKLNVSGRVNTSVSGSGNVVNKGK